MIGKQYFVRQTATVLRFAKSIHDPQVVAALVEKAAEFKSQRDATMPPADLTPLPPDIEPPAST